MLITRVSELSRKNSGLLTSVLLHIFLGVLSGLPLLLDNLWEEPMLIEAPPPIRLSLIRSVTVEKNSSEQKTLDQSPIPKPEPKNMAPQTENTAKKVTKPVKSEKAKKPSPIAKMQAPEKPLPMEAPDTSAKSETSPQVTSKMEPESSAGSVTTSSVQSAESIEYEKALIYLLSKSKRYPERARRRGVSGDGIIRLKLNKDGAISRLELAKSTDSDILDEELINLVKRASPLPPLPDGGRTDFLIPVRFSLRD